MVKRLAYWTIKCEKEKIFGLHPSLQSDLIQKYCFIRCGKVIISKPLLIKDIGLLIPCREEKCPYEKKQVKVGEIENSNYVLYLRILKECDPNERRRKNC